MKPLTRQDCNIPKIPLALWLKKNSETDCFVVFFSGTNAIILNTKTQKKRDRPFALNQMLEAGIVDEGWFHDIFSDSSFSIPDSAIPHHGYVASNLQAHW